MATAYRLEGNHQTLWLALVPQAALAEPLRVQRYSLPFWKTTPAEPEGAIALRQNIAAYTGLQDYGLLGNLIDDEWLYLAKNPNRPDLYGKQRLR